MDLVISSVLPRCGSTLLQRICNGRPENMIWGEPLQTISEFRKMYQKLDSLSKRSRNLADDFLENRDLGAWIAQIQPPYLTPEELKTHCVNTAKYLFEGFYQLNQGKHEIVGFKDLNMDKSDLLFLQDCYPNVNIFLLVRNPIDIWKSIVRLGTGRFDDIIKMWNKGVLEYMTLSKRFPNMHLIRYEDIVARNSITLDLISSVSKVPIDTIHKVLDIRVAGASGETTTSSEIGAGERDRILAACEDLMILLDYHR